MNETPGASLEIAGHTLALVQGDITGIAADAIVNAANSALAGGGGVDGAIHHAGGPEIMADLEQRYGRQRHCPTGEAVISVAGRLPARWVVHAVGPVWRGGGAGEEGLLRAAYRAALGLAEQVGAGTVTLPAISCGIYGYPLADGARVALDAVAGRLAEGGPTIEQATFVLFSSDTFEAFAEALESLRR
jgi:O-acetyl-ADP-ribose deacetylase (regulator of RNase III)